MNVRTLIRVVQVQKYIHVIIILIIRYEVNERGYISAIKIHLTKKHFFLALVQGKVNRRYMQTCDLPNFLGYVQKFSINFMTSLNPDAPKRSSRPVILEPHREKTGFLPMRK